MYRERAVSLIRDRVDQFSIIEHHVNEKIIRFFNGNISLAAAGSSVALQVYATSGKKRSMVVLNNLNDLDRELELFIKRLSQMPDGDVSELPPKTNYTFNNDVDDYIDDDLIARLVGNSIQAAAEAGSERASGILKATEHTMSIITSSGNEGEDKRTSYALNIRAFKEGGSGSGISVSTKALGIDAEGAGKEAGKNSVISRNPRKIEDGIYDVLLGPSVSASIMELVGTSASAILAEIGMSFLSDQLGKRVASEELSLVDYGQIEGGVGSRAFDDEGAATGKTEIIRNGIFNSFLHNSTTAKRWKTRTTGNAGIMEPGPWNLVVYGGRSNEKEMLSEIKRGIVITNNWYTRFNNYRSGEFSTLIRDAAFYVENGEIRYPVSGLRLSDSLPRLISNIILYTENTKWIKWWGEVSVPVKAPAMLVSGCRISVA